MMRALRIDRSVSRFAISRIAASVSTARAAKISSLEHVTIDLPERPGDGWMTLRPLLTGICGSDLALVEGHASPYFEDWVSFPFVPGHEIVGLLEDGTRVVVEPVLGHAARGHKPPHPDAAPADGDDYAHLALPPLKPGIQTGFCCSTGGGWSEQLWVHESQVHRIPDSMSDEAAVLIEPLAGGIHAALMAIRSIAQNEHAAQTTEPVIAVLGAGTMGLAAIAGLRKFAPSAKIIVGARYSVQHRFASALGATEVVSPDDLARAVRRHTGCHMVGDDLSSGAHATIDAVGNSASVDQCIRLTRPRSTVVLMGMPANVSVDMTGLWHRETKLAGSYTYGTENLPDGSSARTFDLAIELAAEIGADRLLSATYRLHEYADALAHAGASGARGDFKIAFDLRPINKESH